jgi:predicted nucleic acid-binding protein
MIIADTDVLIDYLAGRGEAGAVEKYLARGGLQTTAITRFELLSGAKNKKQLARLRQLLTAIPSLPLDDAAADSASEIRRFLEQSGHSIGMADSLIAGIVTSNGGFANEKSWSLRACSRAEDGLSSRDGAGKPDHRNP